MKKKSRDYYLEILNLSEDFKISALKKAYRREAKKWHPDQNKELRDLESYKIMDTTS